MNREDIKAVLFDLGGTLVTHSVPALAAAAGVIAESERLLRESGCEVPGERIQESYTSAWKASKALHYVDGSEFAIAAFLKQWLVSIGVADNAANGLTPILEHAIYERDLELVELQDAARLTLSGLERRGYRIGAITNTAYSHEHIGRILERLEVRDFFSVVTVSSEEGVAKPNPEVYARAIGRLSVKSCEAVFIGNELDVDVCGAQRAGLSAVLYDPESAASSKPLPEGVLAITKLLDILDILDMGSLPSRAKGRTGA